MKKTKLIVFLCFLGLIAIAAFMVYRSMRAPEPGSGSSPPSPPNVSSLTTHPSASSLQPSHGLLGIIGPVRLASEPGAALPDQITAARTILDKFAKAGFQRAIWAVDRLPGKDEDMKPWVESCVKAFPAPPILALDSSIEQDVGTPDPEKLKLFLKEACPRVESVLVNFTHLNNFASTGQETEAIEAAHRNAESVRAVAPRMFLWLMVDDDPKFVDSIPRWVAEFDRVVQGYYLYREHGLNIIRDEKSAQIAKTLMAQKKPVIRCGFAYTAPRMRPGLEDDLRAQYRERMDRYAKWLKQSGFAGYWRIVGDAVPGNVDVNLALLP
mgnify:CR=1 FL=1